MVKLKLIYLYKCDPKQTKILDACDHFIPLDWIFGVPNFIN